MTTMNTGSLLLVAVATAVACAFAPSAATADADPDPYPCPWRTVAHPEDPFIQNLGKWAVDQMQAHMHFDKVVSAKLQGVGQCNTMTHDYYYELIMYVSLRAPIGEGDKYRAVVYVTNFTQPQKVMSFRAVMPPPAATAPAKFSVTS